MSKNSRSLGLASPVRMDAVCDSPWVAVLVLDLASCPDLCALTDLQGCSLHPRVALIAVRSSDLGLPTHSLGLVLGVSCGGGHFDCPNPQHKYSHLWVFRENGGMAPSLLHSPNLQHS